jgi:hypothetical protein
MRRESEELAVPLHSSDNLAFRTPLLEEKPQIEKEPRPHDMLADAI